MMTYRQISRRKAEGERRKAEGTTAHCPLPTAHCPRRGTSLSEVLVSTLVMSIGVVALATLFPISVLRSIQASQLTNAANLRYNAEAQARAVPELINIGVEWQPAATYNQFDVVVPTLNVRRKTPPAVYVCNSNGMSGGAEPIWSFVEGGTTTDAGTEWSTVTLNNYVIDPLGFMLVDAADADNNFRGAGVTGARQHFGNIYGTPYLPLVNRFPAFGLFNPADSAALNEFRSASAVVLPDSWISQAESLELANVTATSIDLLGVDFNDLSQSVTTPTPDLVPDRLLLLDETGRRSHSLGITGLAAVANGTTVSWPAAQSIPAGFTPVRARVESLERRYSYVLSVRRSPGGASHVDCVVFFRRSYGVQDEQVYSAVFRKIDRGLDGQPGVAGTDDNNDGTDDNAPELNFPLSDDKTRNFCILQYDSLGQKPFFKKGGFVCDAHNLRWYRIIDTAESVFPHAIADVVPAGFEADPVAPGMDRFVRLTLDQSVIEDSPFTTGTLTPQTITRAGVDTIGGAILMRGVVDVFPFRPRTF